MYITPAVGDAGGLAVGVRVRVSSIFNDSLMYVSPCKEMSSVPFFAFPPITKPERFKNDPDPSFRFTIFVPLSHRFK